MKRNITKLLPEKEEVELVFTGTKLHAKFNIKDKTSKEHQCDLTHSVVSPDLNCNEEYNGKTSRRLIEKVHKHSDKDVTFHVFKYSIETDHPTVTIDRVCVLKTRYCQRRFRKKLSESLFIKQEKLVLNKQEESDPLQLFN